MNDIKVGSIQVDGLRDLEIALLHYPDKLAKTILTYAIREGSKVFKEEAIKKAPISVKPHVLKSYASSLYKKFDSKKLGVWILPGNLKRMIRIKIDKSGTRGHKISYEVFVRNKEAWYWKFQEFGTSKMPAANNGEGFMRIAFEAVKEEVVEVVKQRILANMER